MAGIILPHPPALPITQPKQIPQRGTPSLPPPVSVLVPSGPRSGHLGLDSFSPVNQNGSFEFDRVLKSGEVYKRTKKTKVELINGSKEISTDTTCLAMEKFPFSPPPKPPLHL